jgi:nifR3 family TIM-barrel protein
MALAPMANVTDAAFRRMFAECGKPDIFWTEFVSVEGLLSEGRERLLPDFWFGEDEHPIVAQIFGGKPEQFEEIGPLLQELGFDGIDINMGCPDRAVEKSGGGASLIRDPERAKQIIRAAKKGAGGLPVSVKTRLGYSKNQMDKWVPALLEEGLAALTMHLRTRKEMSDAPAHWELAPELAKLRDRYAPQTLVLGNGDVGTLEEAGAKTEEAGLDGVMVGRGAFGNPWFFSGRTPDLKERLERMVTHTEFFQKMYQSDSPDKSLKNFSVMRKHYKAYVSGFDGAKELRVRLMEAENAEEVRAITAEVLALL